MKGVSLSILLLGLIALVSGIAEYGAPGTQKTCECGWRNTPQSKIIGGELVSLHEWPAFVGISERLPDHVVRQCGGTILTKRHVGLPAHCVKHIIGESDEDYELSNPDNMTVYFDVIEKHNAPESHTRGVEKFHYDQRFKGGGQGHDIALLVIKGEFPFDKNVGPACFPSFRVPNRQKAITMGYGFINWESTKVGRKLKMLHTTTYARAHCNRVCQDHGFILRRPEQICTIPKNGTATRKGDSGGPLFWYDQDLNRYVLAGVLSFGITNKHCSGVGGFTDVTYYRRFIFNKIKEDGEEAPCHAQRIMVGFNNTSKTI